ncbi:hypothetical protein [Rhodococcus phenolicus]|uniref:hypothetical protein n=1 Tax=Rhodococcus phenolicus TaxID=263849 RepID=UPI000829746B|nr:hypothetical protein [Rhodococcus phenolicus]
MTVDTLAAFIAETLMPGAPALVADTAEQLARAILKRHDVVELPAPSFEDEDGVTWSAAAGDFQFATVAGPDVWVAGEILSPDELQETAAALLAARRLALAERAEVRRMTGVAW